MVRIRFVSDAIALIRPCDLALPWQGEGLPVAFLDLMAAGNDDLALHLPPFPLIGLGDAAHPLAPWLDAVVEAPFTAAMLQQACHDQPEAAAILVQLLRLIEGLEVEAALIAESLAYAVLQGSDGHRCWQAARRMEPALPPGRVLLERSDDLLTILLDRPAAHNAIDRTMRDALREAFELAALDRDIQRIELRGAGKAFSLGADLSEFGSTRDPATAHAIRMASLPAHAIARCADRLNVHVPGACVGSGLEMAAFAHRLTAGRAAWFQLPELAMGIIPGAGGCVSVSRRIGRQRAALLMLTGRRISAETALGWGLIDGLVDD